MRVFCTGFNLYGQFIKCCSLVVEAFIDCSYDDITDLELSHTFTLALTRENDVVLHGAKGDQTHQIQKIQIPEKLSISQTSCTDKRILFLSTNGELFKLDLEHVHELPLLLPVSSEPQDQFTKIASGSKINIALSQQGKVFSLPNRLNYVNQNVVDVSTGCEHCILLDKQGNIYSFGRGSRGQLGHGNLEDEPEPKLIQALAGINISKIAAGGWHSCAISAEGDLYTWGWNGNGQLGLFKTEQDAVSVMASPHVVDFEDSQTQEALDLNVINIACGNRHTVVLLDNGKLFGAGWNKYHQLGSVSSSNENVYPMTALYNFSGLNVTDLKCGPWSTAVIVS